jgi:hypothetical protein
MGLLDDEDALASKVMEELGFENAPVLEEIEAPPMQEVVEPPDTFVTQELFVETPAQKTVPPITEVELRLAKAHLYNQIISSPLFEGEGEVVQEVEEEFQSFARKQLQTLLGIAAPAEQPVVQQAQPQFSDEEVVILRRLIERVSQSPKVLEPVKPQVRAKPQPAAPAPKPTPIPRPAPAPAKAPKPARPTLKVRKVPEEVPQKVKPAPAQKQTTAPAPKPPQQVNPRVIPADGSTIEENGKKFLIKYVQMHAIDEFGLMDGAKIRKLGNKQGCVLSNGIQVFRDGETYTKVLRTVLTSNEHTPQHKPFPSRKALEKITESAANRATGKLPSDIGDINRRINPPNLSTLLGR